MTKIKFEIDIQAHQIRSGNYRIKYRKVGISKLLRQILMALKDEIPASKASISLTFTDNTSIQKLNSDYRKKNKPTDVLSFPQLDHISKAFEIVPLGDLVISSEVLLAQAKAYRTTVNLELARLLVHGSLHLLGYDHENVTPKVAQRMRRKEKKILKALTMDRQPLLESVRVLSNSTKSKNKLR